jgi:hypothetical protein
VLDDAEYTTVRIAHDAAVSSGVRDLGREHSHGVAVVDVPGHQVGQGVRRQQRHVTVGDHDDPLELGHRVQRTCDGMSGPELTVLNGDRGPRRRCRQVLGHLLAAMADNDDEMIGLESRRRRYGVADHRAAGQLVHDLGDR